MAGPIFWAMEDSPEVLRFYRDWVADAPDELMTIVVHPKAPPLPFVPEHVRGKPVVMVTCCWAGDVEDGERAIRPMKEFGNPVADVCAAKPFLAHQAMFDPSFPPGRWYYFKSCDVPGLTDEIIDTTVEHSLQISSPLTSFPIWQMGGAVARVGEHETAFNGRNAGFTYNISASPAASLIVHAAKTVTFREAPAFGDLTRNALTFACHSSRRTGTTVGVPPPVVSTAKALGLGVLAAPINLADEPFAGLLIRSAGPSCPVVDSAGSAFCSSHGPRTSVRNRQWNTYGPLPRAGLLVAEHEFDPSTVEINHASVIKGLFGQLKSRRTRCSERSRTEPVSAVLVGSGSA